jgi:hypothetical protein
MPRNVVKVQTASDNLSSEARELLLDVHQDREALLSRDVAGPTRAIRGRFGGDPGAIRGKGFLTRLRGEGLARADSRDLEVYVF